MSQKETLKRIIKLIKPYWFYFCLSLLFAVITVGFTLYAPILVGDAIDYIIAKGQVDFDSIRRILVILAGVIILTSFAQWLMTLFNNRITYHVVKDIRIKTFRHMEELPLSYLDSNSNGSIISKMITDVDQFSDGLLMGFSQLFTGVITIAGTIGFMFSINIGISFLVILLTPLSLFVARFIARRTFHMFQQQSELRGEMTGYVEEQIGGQKVVKAFGREDENQKQFEEINERLRVCGVRALFYSALTNPCTRFINGLVYAGVGILGAITAMNGRITVGQLSCFLTYANQYTKPFNEISGVVTELQGAIASAKRVFELMEEPKQKEDERDAVHLTQVDGSLALRDVNFSYDKEVSLIEGLNLTVKPGQRIAIVGPTGCGKTTIINLLMRFYDIDSGQIIVSGYDYQQVTRDSLRKNYGMVLQDTWLKPGTIAQNIAYGKPDATMEEIEAAARKAHAHSFIKRLKKGYDTLITEEGGNLSQGQKQLLCIARVMLCLPPMLILDEATSSIDTRTEIQIQKAFAEMMKGRTSFIVAHRLSTIKEADQILVMNKGHVIEQGTHQELLSLNGFYGSLYNSQFASTKEPVVVEGAKGVENRLDKEMRVYELLERLKVSFWRLDHEETATIEDCHEVDKILQIEICKNLFLCNSKKDQYYLLMMPGNKKFRTAEVAKQLKSTRLSFGSPEYMEKYLDITPGSVSVFGLMNDTQNKVQLVIDQDIMSMEYVGCHPCINTSSLKLRTQDLLEVVLPAIGHSPIVVNLEES